MEFRSCEGAMANHLAMSKVNGILELHQEGWSQRRIARTLGIDRKTVTAHLAAEASKRAKAPTGEAPTGSDDSKWAKAPTGSEMVIGTGEAAPMSISLDDRSSSKPCEANPTEGKGGESAVSVTTQGGEENSVSSTQPSRSACGPWRTIIEEKLDQGLTAQRIHQDLVADHGFTGKYPSVRRFVARLQASRPLPFRRVEVAPGEEAQVDFGTGVSLSLPDVRAARGIEPQPERVQRSR